MKHANVSVFVPHCGCPHQCSFCNQNKITGNVALPGSEDVEQAVQTALRNRNDFDRAEIAFFGGSFTAMDNNYQDKLLKAAWPFVKDGSFSGIRISTRPDAIDEKTLYRLQTYGVSAIELGAQSMNDHVLKLNGRGHTAQQVKSASALVQSFGFSLGLQMMTGLWGSTKQTDCETAKQLAELDPETMRIYPTLVMEDTALARLYQRGEYNPPDLEETVALCAELLDFFEGRGIRVIRLGLHSAPELEKGRLAGPYHPAFGELCRGRLFLLRLLRALQKQKIPFGPLTVFISPADISKSLGQKKCNVSALAEHGWQINFVQLDSVLRGRFRFYDARLGRNVDFYG